MDIKKPLLTKSIVKVNKKGKGSGSNYVPGLTPRTPSEGLKSSPFSYKTGRSHVFLSKIERDYFYLLEFDDDIMDIKEQYLLELPITTAIAEKHGYKHPKSPKTKKIVQMSCDFYVIRRNESVFARSVKPSEKLELERVKEKLLIEEEYFHSTGVHDWKPVTRESVDEAVAYNLAQFRGYYFIGQYYPFSNMSTDKIMSLANILRSKLISNRFYRLTDICHEFDESQKLDRGCGLALFRFLVIRKMIKVNLEEKINPLRIINITEG